MYYAVGYRRRRGDMVLDVWYPVMATDPDQLDALGQWVPNQDGTHALSEDQYRACRDSVFPTLPLTLPSDPMAYSVMDPVLTVLRQEDDPIDSTESAYFRLQLLSQRLVRPHGQNLTGLFEHLPNMCWTNMGPVLPEDMPIIQGQNWHVSITHVDKFPYMVQYHVPAGVRIADASRVRLGAYLSEGTTVMPAGFVNFNAGTLGSAMIEGRISAGVVVGDRSDAGGGASIMGTLSGGNNHVISIGEQCLLGANAGTGISLGDGCTVAAGVYVYAGKKVRLLDANNQPVDMDGNPVSEGHNVVKAMALSGQSYRLYLEDSQTGALICKPNTTVIQLNDALHVNE